MLNWPIPDMEIILDPGALMPSYSTDGAAAIDLRVHLTDQPPVEILPGEVKVFSVGFKIHIKDPDICMKMLPRSGLGSRGLILRNTVGLIDSDYQGKVQLGLWNRNSAGGELFLISHGDRVAQAVFLPIVRPMFICVANFTDSTERGENGFGSTGVS